MDIARTSPSFVGFMTSTKDKRTKTKTKPNIQWMDLPFYARQWESTLSLCQYKYHLLASRVSDHINQWRIFFWVHLAIGYLAMLISQVCCCLVLCLLASACDRCSCADLHLHARAPSVHLSQVLLLPLSSLLVLLFGFVLFCLSCFQFCILHCMYFHLYFGTFCLCLYPSRYVCVCVCVFLDNECFVSR
jgi:hypothetical protein